MNELDEAFNDDLYDRLQELNHESIWNDEAARRHYICSVVKLVQATHQLPQGSRGVILDKYAGKIVWEVIEGGSLFFTQDEEMTDEEVTEAWMQWRATNLTGSFAQRRRGPDFVGGATAWGDEAYDRSWREEVGAPAAPRGVAGVYVEPNDDYQRIRNRIREIAESREKEGMLPKGSRDDMTLGMAKKRIKKLEEELQAAKVEIAKLRDREVAKDERFTW